MAPVELANAVDTVRLSLHILAATVWIGGQMVVAGLLPTVRGFGGDAPAKVARAFARLSWPAFVVLIVTGVWNIAALNNGAGNHDWQMVLGIKMATVLLAGAAVAIHVRTTTPRSRGVSAGVGLLASLAAMVLGVVLAG